MQYESSRNKKKNSTNFNVEVKQIDEGLNHTNQAKIEDNVHKQHTTNRLKRVRSPSMIFDHGDSLSSKARRSNENVNCNNRELRRIISKDERKTRNDFFDSSKDIVHRERITKGDAVLSHCNKSNMAGENVECDRASRMHYGRQDIEQEQILNRTHHRRKEFEQERSSMTHHRRQDMEQGHASRIHNRRQQIEQKHVNKIHHGMHDVEKRGRSNKQDFEMIKELNERNNLRYEDFKRNYDGQEISPESRQLMSRRELSPKSRRQSGLRELELECRRFRSPRDLSPKLRHITTSQDMLDEQRSDTYDKYGLRNHGHDIKRSPEKSREAGISRNQCIEDESKRITYPKWFTAQTNIGGLGRVEGNRLTNFSVDLESEAFEKDNLKFPTLHGNYGNHDFSMHSQTYGSDYRDLTKDIYMDLHSPRLQTDYSNSKEMTFMQKNNYDIFGVHDSPKDFNCFDVERNYENQRYGINSLHSFGHLDGNIGRDYRINDFPQNSSIGFDIPSISKNIHEDSWKHLSQKNGLLNSYRNDINHAPITKAQDYTTSWNTMIPSSPSSSFRQSSFENPPISSLGSSWNQSSLYSLPSTNSMPFPQRELWP